MGLKGNMEITCSFFWFMGYIKSGESPRFLFAFLFVRFPLVNFAYFLPHLQGKRHLYLILSFGSLFGQPHSDSSCTVSDHNGGKKRI